MNKVLYFERNERMEKLVDDLNQLFDGGIREELVVKLTIEDQLAELVMGILQQSRIEFEAREAVVEKEVKNNTPTFTKAERSTPVGEGKRCEVCGEPTEGRSTICGSEACKKERQRRWQKRHTEKKRKGEGSGSNGHDPFDRSAPAAAEAQGNGTLLTADGE